VARPINVTITGDYNDKDIKRAIKDLQSLQKEAPKTVTKTTELSKATTGLGYSWKSAALNIAAATVSVGAITKAIQSSIQSASALEQSIGATDALFGMSSESMQRWAEEASAALGLSSSQALDAANRFATAGKQMGLSSGELVGFTQDMTQQAADMAAMFGGTVTESVTALSAAFRGEFDPAERYGLALRATAIEAEAAALGFSKVNGQFSQAAKNSAVASLIRQQNELNGVVGAFAREGDTYAGTVQRVQAAVENASATIGTELLDSIGDVSEALGGSDGLVAGIEGAGKAIADLIDISNDAIGPLTTLSGAIDDVVPDWLGSFWDLDWGRVLGPLGGLVEGIGLSKDAADLAGRQNEFLTQGYVRMAAPIAEAVAGQEDMASSTSQTTVSVNKQISALDRLRAATDRMDKGRSIMRQRLSLQQLIADGPAQSGQRTVIGADGKETVQRFSTKRDRRLFALDVADARAQLAESIYDRGDGSDASRERARLQLVRGRRFIRGLGLGSSFQSNVLSSLQTPEELLPGVTNQQRVAGAQLGAQPTTVNYNFAGDIVVQRTEQAIEEAKRLARLAAAGRGPVAPVRAVG
jgi:hypothetical protein